MLLCEKCELKCKNKGKDQRENLEPVPNWCPHPEVKYPENRIAGGGIQDYAQQNI